MARGGYRPGAGRPRGSKNRANIPGAAAAAGKTPLDYMLDIMHDESLHIRRRADMAIAAAPFVHKRLS